MKNVWCPKGAFVIRAGFLVPLCSNEKAREKLRKAGGAFRRMAVGANSQGT